MCHDPRDPASCANPLVMTSILHKKLGEASICLRLKLQASLAATAATLSCSTSIDVPKYCEAFMKLSLMQTVEV